MKMTQATQLHFLAARGCGTAGPLGLDPGQATTRESALTRGDRLHRMLVAELATAGCFRPATARSFVYGLFIVSSYVTAYVTLLANPSFLARASAVVVLAFVSIHAGFLSHEAHHGALTRRRLTATSAGQAFGTLLTAVSYSYFCHIHSLHHPHCNDRSRDPDMQSEFFSMYRQSAETKTGLGRLISRQQAMLIWILVWLQGFTLKIDGVRFLCRNAHSTRLDQAALLLHILLWFVPPSLILGLGDALVNYAFMTLLCGPYLGTIFLVNHIGTRVIEPDEPESFFLHEISTTRNLGTWRLQDFLFGGLNNHIEHHLFPSIPTARLPAARVLTRDFCRRHSVSYREMSWLAAAREVALHFKRMSAFVPRKAKRIDI